MLFRPRNPLHEALCWIFFGGEEKVGKKRGRKGKHEKKREGDVVRLGESCFLALRGIDALPTNITFSAEVV